MNKKRFTLIELLVVITIIAIVAGIVASGTTFISRLVKESYTKSQMQKLTSALSAYKAEYDMHYMASEISGSGKVKFVDEPVEFNPVPNPYDYDMKLNFDHKTLRQRDGGMIKFCSRVENRKNELDKTYTPITFLGEEYTYYDENEPDRVKRKNSGFRDGWGNLFLYISPGKYNHNSYDLWSRGADGDQLDYGDEGQDDEDDFTNWKTN